MIKNEEKGLRLLFSMHALILVWAALVYTVVTFYAPAWLSTVLLLSFIVPAISIFRVLMDSVEKDKTKTYTSSTTTHIKFSPPQPKQKRVS